MGEEPGADGEIQEFVTGSRHEVTPERRLGTVLFTDLVDSTEKAAELGDGAWKTLSRLTGDPA